MIDTILRYMGVGTPRPIFNWTRALTTLQSKIDIQKSCFLGAPYMRTSGTNLLTNLIRDIVAGITETDPASTYTRIESAAYTLRNRFDLVYNPNIGKGLFVEDPSISEYILNVTGDSPLINYPLSSNSQWYQWKDLRPMRVIYHNSRELNVFLMTYKLKFQQRKPNWIAYSLNVPLMCVQYMAYQKNFPDKTVEDYVKEQVMAPLLDDLVRCWLLNTLVAMMDYSWDVSEFPILPGGMIASWMEPGYADVRQLCQAAYRQGLSVGDICSTKWFGDSSIVDLMRMWKSELVMPPMNQYEALEFLAMWPYLLFTVETTIAIGRRDMVPMARSLVLDLEMFKRRSTTSNLYNQGIRDAISSELSYLIKRLKPLAYG